MKKILLIITFVAISLPVFSQTFCDSLLSMKKQFYNFKESELTDSIKESKGKELDSFWKIVMDRPVESAPCLNDMILNDKSNSYFCFDASSLLLRLDTTNKYIPTIINVLNDINLDEIKSSLSSYLKYCCYLGISGYNISNLAYKIISQPDLQIFIPQHKINLNGRDAGIFLYNIMPNDTAEKYLIEAIKSGNPTAMHNASLVLNMLSTNKGDSLINKLIESKQLKDTTINCIKNDREIFILNCKGDTPRDTILKYFSYEPFNMENNFFGFANKNDLICSAIDNLTKQDENLIREVRRKAIQGISDESLYEYYAITYILMTVRNRK